MRIPLRIKVLLLVVFVTTVFCGLTYVCIQQTIRMSANDPQIQIAEDSADKLKNGVLLESIVGDTKIDIEKSLAPFIVVYNSYGEVMTSNAVLRGSVPVLPKGVLEAVHTESRLTWQPMVHVREAIVVVQFDKGYVLAGRSLHEVEKREEMVFAYILTAWIVGIIGSFVIIVCIPWEHRKK